MIADPPIVASFQGQWSCWAGRSPGPRRWRRRRLPRLPSRRHRRPARRSCAPRTSACWSGRATRAASSPPCPRALRSTPWRAMRSGSKSGCQRQFGGPGDQRGFVFEGHVAFVSGPALSALPSRSTAATAQAGAAAARPRQPAPRFGIRGYGEGAYTWFTAADSFKAIFDTSGGSFLWGRSAGLFRPDLRGCRRVPVQEDRRTRVRVRGRRVSRRHSRSHHDDAVCRHRRLPVPSRRPQRPLPGWRRGVPEVRGDV